MKRTPLRKRGRHAATVKELDRLARAVVFKRDGEKCVRCGRTANLQWAHVYSRRYHSLRWDADNSMVLCAGCHLLWHHQPVLMSQWWRNEFPKRENRLAVVTLTGRRPDRAAIRLALEMELKGVPGSNPGR